MIICRVCKTQQQQGATNCPICGVATTVYYVQTGTMPNASTVLSSSPLAGAQRQANGYGSPSYQARPQPTYGIPSSVPYEPYPNLPPPPPPPPLASPGSRVRLIAGIVLLTLVLVGSGLYALQLVLGSQRASSHASTAVAVSNPYTHTGKLVLFDPLRDNSKGVNWAQDPINCGFMGGAYHVKAPDPNYYDDCLANDTNYSNFVVEVQMQLVKGDGGGILFRNEDTAQASRNYALDVYQDGSYNLNMLNGSSNPVLASGSSPAIKRGLNQSNLLAVIAQGNTITVYVNHQRLASVTDSTLSYGRIGLEAVPNTSNGHPTEVVFSNAKVWTL